MAESGSQERQAQSDQRTDVGQQAAEVEGSLVQRAQAGDPRAVKALRLLRARRAAATPQPKAKPPAEELAAFGVSVDEFTDYCKHHNSRGWDGAEAAGLVDKWRISHAVARIPGDVQQRVRRQLLHRDGDDTLVMEEIGGAAVIGTRQENAERKADARAKLEQETLSNMTGGIVGAIAGGIAELRHPEDRDAIHAASGIGAPFDNMIGAVGIGGSNEPRLEPPTERAVNQHSSPTHEAAEVRVPAPREPAARTHSEPASSAAAQPHAQDASAHDIGNGESREHEQGSEAKRTKKTHADSATLEAFEAMLASGEYKAKVEELTPFVAKLRSHPEWGPLLSDHSDLELMALIGYTGADYKIINQALRGNSRELYLKLKPYIHLSTEALLKLPDYSGICRRGVRELPANILDQYQVGRVVVEAGFTSTTYGTEPFKGKVQFIIDAKRAKKIDFMSLYPDQKEALIAPGAQFKVTERVQVADTIYIRMEEQ